MAQAGGCCSEVWFQGSCLGLGAIYLFIISINDTFFLFDLLGTEWPGSKTDLILPLNSYWCLFRFTFYLHKWEPERKPCSLTESHGIPWGKLMDVADTRLPGYQTCNNFCPHTQCPLAPRWADSPAPFAQTRLPHFNTSSLWGGTRERALHCNFCNSPFKKNGTYKYVTINLNIHLCL